MKKFLKGILLYATIIYSLIFVIAVESLGNIHLSLPFIGIFIWIILIVICYELLKNDDLNEYIPKWFK